MEEILAKIQENYPIKNPQVVEKVTQGVLSDNFVLESDQTKYFLKKYRFDSEEKIQSIHQVKQFFSTGGIPIILPIPTSDGPTYFEVGQQFYAVFPFVLARSLKRGEVTRQSTISLAQTLAKMHLLGKDKTIPGVPLGFNNWNKTEILVTVQEILKIINNKPSKDAFDRLALQDIEILKRIIENNSSNIDDYALERNHLIHGDFQETNIFFDRDGHVSHIFDLEKTEVAPRIFELLRSINYMFLNGEFSSGNIQSALLYLRTYHQAYPLSHDELVNGLKAYFLRYAHDLWILKEHYLNNNSRPDMFLPYQYQTILYLSENLETFTQTLLIGMQS